MKRFQKMHRWLVLLTLLAASGVVSPNTARAFESVGGNLQWPLAMGQAGQNFTSNLGLTADLYFDRFLDPAVANFISIGYESFTLNADGKSSFRILPVMAGIELPGKVWENFYTTFGIAAGMAVTFISGTNTSTYSYNEYFMAQLRPGFQWDLGGGFSLVGRVPVNFMIGKSELTYGIFEAGLKFKL